VKASTAGQMANAFMKNTGPKEWSVVGKWKLSDTDHTMHTGMTYRQAKATARAIREAFGYANVVKAS
jgi:hypothetical protein